MPDDPPILDYAPPPEPLVRRSVEYIRKSWAVSFFIVRPLRNLFWFFFVRQLRPVEEALIGWPLMCVLNVLCAANAYFYRQGFDLKDVYRFIDCFAPAVALAMFIPITRILMRRRWLTGLSILLFAFALAPLTGIIRLELFRDDERWMLVFKSEPTLKDFPFHPYRQPGSKELLWWMDDLPGWKSY